MGQTGLEYIGDFDSEAFFVGTCRAWYRRRGTDGQGGAGITIIDPGSTPTDIEGVGGRLAPAGGREMEQAKQLNAIISQVLLVNLPLGTKLQKDDIVEFTNQTTQEVTVLELDIELSPAENGWQKYGGRTVVKGREVT